LHPKISRCTLATGLALLVAWSPAWAQKRTKGSIPEFVLNVSFVGSSIADTALTIHGTKYHGLVEQNRLLRPFFERGRTIDYFIVWNIQMAGTAAILMACHFLIKQDDKTSRFFGYALLVGVNVARAYIVIQNARLNASAHR
jgi:hypothetical protein